jgi:hypothetical protein
MASPAGAGANNLEDYLPHVQTPTEGMGCSKGEGSVLVLQEAILPRAENPRGEPSGKTNKVGPAEGRFIPCRGGMIWREQICFLIELDLMISEIQYLRICISEGA